jgi:hypothetical protein
MRLDWKHGMGALLVLVGCSRTQTKTPVTTTAGNDSTTTESGARADARGQTLVRIVNADPSHPTVTLTTDNQTPFTEVAYKTVTPYREVEDNVTKFEVYDAKTGVTTTPLATNREVMADGARYTLVLMPASDGDAPVLKALRDELVPAEGKAKIRLVNAAPAAGEVDLNAEGLIDPIFDNVNVGTEAGFKDVDPTSGSLMVRQDKGKRTLVTVKDVKALEPGMTYTIVLAGRPGGWQAITFSDAVQGVGAGVVAKP